MKFTKQQLEDIAGSVPFWFHSINLGEGVTTKGWKSAAQLMTELDRLKLPDLHGKSVLDINSWDGFFAFEAERRGAKRVVALDQYMWAMDLAEHLKYCNECKDLGIAPAPYHTMPYYKPGQLPGKAGFDTAHKALNSQVEVIVGDFMEMDLKTLGTFDVVLYLGSLYHMENPLQALRRLASITKEVGIVESEAAEFPCAGDHALFEFFESNELQGDVSNWWAPNEKGLAGICRAAGFRNVDVITGSPLRATEATASRPLAAKLRSAAGSMVRQLSNSKKPTNSTEVVRYRAVVHAWK